MSFLKLQVSLANVFELCEPGFAQLLRKANRVKEKLHDLRKVSVELRIQPSPDAAEQKPSDRVPRLRRFGRALRSEQCRCLAQRPRKLFEDLIRHGRTSALALSRGLARFFFAVLFLRILRHRPILRL